MSESPGQSPGTIPEHLDHSTSYFDKPTSDHNATYNLEIDPDNDPSTLPFPAPLARSAFLDPDFDALTYLSTLHNRHQTLADLRTDLRVRAADLSTELSDLVNSEYETFLSVGDVLHGGSDQLEQVDLGVRGFRNQIIDIAEAVREKQSMAGELIDERRALKRQIAVGKRLLGLERSVDDLARRLGVGESSAENDDEKTSVHHTLNDESESDSESDDDDASAKEKSPVTAMLPRLRAHTTAYLQIQILFTQLGPHLFLNTLQPQIDTVRKTLLLDLATALRLGRQTDEIQADKDVLLEVMRMYASMGDAKEAVRVLGGR